MRKLYLLILSMFAFGLAQEAMAQNIPSAATLDEAPNVCIKNVRSGNYVYAAGVGNFIQTTAASRSLCNVFRFVVSGEGYKIFSVGRNKWINNVTKSTYATSESSAQIWYTGDVSGNGQFYLSSTQNPETTARVAWNDLNRNALTYWEARDEGSKWVVEEVSNVNQGFQVYRPTQRLAALRNGVDIMILNTTVTSIDDRTGFLQSKVLDPSVGGNINFHKYEAVSLPLAYQEGTAYHVFTLEESTTTPGKWWLKNKATNRYVSSNGNITSVTGVDLTIDEFSASPYKASVSSLNDNGTMTASNGITTDNHLWAISNGTVPTESNKVMWNGNPGELVLWSSAHPFAFYEVETVETTLASRMTAVLSSVSTQAIQDARGKVGAPADEFYTALDAAHAVSDKTSLDFFNKAFTAVVANAYAGIKMPEDGKAYAVVSVTNPSRTDAEAYMVVGSDARISLSTGNGYSTNNAAKFVARKQADGKYVLSNGRYNRTLQFTGNTERTLSEGYDPSYSPISIVSMDPSKAEVKLLVRRSSSVPSCAIIVNKQNNVLDKISGENWTGNQQFSIRFRLEEVGYPVSTTLRESGDVQGAAAMSTWSAPYASVCPEGVKAYYVSENGTVARMTAVEGAIPANQGVVLVGAEAGEKTPLPVAGEQVGTITDNLLGNTAGQAATIEEGCFVLSQKNSVTAFYKLSDYANQLPANRAYLTASAAGGGSRQLVFGFDDATGIPTLQDAAQQNQPTYDLSGRAVSAKRQGLYIRGGKKFVVK